MAISRKLNLPFGAGSFALEALHGCCLVGVLVQIQQGLGSCFRHLSLQVTTVDGPVDLRIPPGTQPGTTLVMAKRGVPRLGSETIRGDHQV